MDFNENLKENEQTNEKMLEDIINKTNKIHASFLFWGPVTNLLKQLSMVLCATPTSLRYNGWPELGVQLGLEQNAVKSIENTQILQQDPVYTMLLAYSQQNNATIADIYFALFQLGRKDVIQQTHGTLLEFNKKILLQFTIPSNGILKPPRIPEAPHIFQSFQQTEEQDEKNKKDEVKTKQCKKIVLLTYVPEKNDKTEKKGIVEKVKEEFRKEFNGMSIGVLTLEEHRKKILENPNYVQMFCSSAHYIIVILTSDYLTHIGSGNTRNNCLIDNMDKNYAPYIYNYMNFDYLKNGCKNKRIRCIIPDDNVENVKKHYFYQPLFQSWTKESDITKMAELILDGKI